MSEVENKGPGGGDDGHGGGKDKVRITVNTTDSTEPKGKITYQRVVEIGFPEVMKKLKGRPLASVTA